MNNYEINYLSKLESESIYIFREVAAEFKNPVMLYSVGKDSSVLLHLARKAFAPGKLPFPLLHINTGFKPREMIAFRDYIIKKLGVNCIVHQNREAKATALKPEDAHSDNYIYLKKTKPLLAAIKKNKFDAAIGGARREEEKSRAKERIFSVRNKRGVWEPKDQRPELWHLYNCRLRAGQTIRVFPLSNWTEVDIWRYIKRENIEVVPLYFAKKRKAIIRHGIYLRLDDFVKAEPKEKIIERSFRYRTLGCSPSTGMVTSAAKTLDAIIKEVLLAKRSERENRAIDHTGEAAMEQKKKEGYF